MSILGALKPIRVEDMKQEGVDCFRTGRFGSALGAVPRSVCKRAGTRDAEADQSLSKVAISIWGSISKPLEGSHKRLGTHFKAYQRER